MQKTKTVLEWLIDTGIDVTQPVPVRRCQQILTLADIVLNEVGEEQTEDDE